MEFAQMTGELQRLRNSYEAVRLSLGAVRGVRFAEQHDGSAHVEFSDGRYQYVVTDRGVEVERRSASSMDEIMYWLARDESHSQACGFELQNRIPNHDPRRLMFAKHVISAFGTPVRTATPPCRSEQGANQFARQQTIFVDPGDRWQFRQVRCIRHHF